MIKANIMLNMASVALAIAATGYIGVEAWAQGTGKSTYYGPNIPTVTRSIDNGQVVTYGFVDENNVQYLEALKNDPLHGPASAFLVLQVTARDLSSQVCNPDPVLGQVCSYTRTYYDFAVGDIPPEDMNVTPNGARLLTNIANNTNVAYMRCVVDTVAQTTFCSTVPPTGIIDLTLTKTNTDYFKYNGIVETKTGPQIVKTIGNEKEFFARVRGTVIGWPISATAQAVFATNSIKTIEIIHAP